jgi:hypothetical protein
MCMPVTPTKACVRPFLSISPISDALVSSAHETLLELVQKTPRPCSQSPRARLFCMCHPLDAWVGHSCVAIQLFMMMRSALIRQERITRVLRRTLCLAQPHAPSCTPPSASLGPFSTRAERPKCMMLGVHTLGCAQDHLRSPATPAQPGSRVSRLLYFFFRAWGWENCSHRQNNSHTSSHHVLPTHAQHAAGSNMALNPARIMFLVAAFALKADAVCSIPSNVLDVRCAAGCFVRLSLSRYELRM